MVSILIVVRFEFILLSMVPSGYALLSSFFFIFFYGVIKSTDRFRKTLQEMWEFYSRRMCNGTASVFNKHHFLCLKLYNTLLL